MTPYTINRIRTKVLEQMSFDFFSYVFIYLCSNIVLLYLTSLFLPEFLISDWQCFSHDSYVFGNLSLMFLISVFLVLLI